MRLALLTFYPARPGVVIGGIDSVAYNLVEALRGDPDLEIHVVFAHPHVPRDEVQVENGVTFHRLASPPQRVVPNLVANLRRVETVLRRIQPDLVNAHTGEYAVASLRTGLPTVYTVHGLAGRELLAPATPFEKLSLVVLLLYERYALRRVQHVVSLTDFGEAYLRPHTRAALHRVDNPVSPHFFALPPAPDDRQLLALGSIHPLKNQRTLIEAMARIHAQRPDVCLRSLGLIVNQRYHAELKAAVAGLDLQAHVHMGELVPPGEVAAAMARSSLLLHASRHDHAPMVISEAMAAGRPVIAGHVGGIPSLVRHGQTGLLVPVGDAAAMADAVLHLLAEPDLRERMGQRAREDARARFWPPVVAAKYRAVYAAALGARQAAPAEPLPAFIDAAPVPPAAVQDHRLG